MNTFLTISLLITANLLLAASFEKRAVFDQVLPRAGVTIPGTKWCGFGRAAGNYDDLGNFNQTDMCCRSHKQCEEVIEPLGSLHALYNPSILPKFNCKCDQELLNCLREVNDIPSVMVGQAYFTMMHQCFAEDYPAIECVEFQEGRIGKRCIKYKFNLSLKKEWQFFDLPFFTIKEE